MLTISHSGDIGDIIYSGPTLRAIALKKGEQIDLVVYPNTGQVRVRQTEESIEPLLKLMRQQHYIGQARYSGHPEGFNFDVWRLFQWGRASLAVMQLRPHLEQLGVTESEVERAWLASPVPNRIKPVIIHRSPRYHGLCFPWKRIVEKYSTNIGMVGAPDEHAKFCTEFGYVEYVPTADFVALSEVIAGSDLFIGNQSAPYAVAEGLKHHTIQETRPDYPDCVFPRDNAQFSIDGKLTLPDLDDMPARDISAGSNVEVMQRPPLRGVGEWVPPKNGDDLVNHDPHWNAVASDVLR